MKIVNLGQKNSVLNKFVAQMRDKEIQKDSLRFRRNLERLGEIFAYEISQTLNASPKDVVTPLGIANVPVYDDKLVVATILRAGLPLHQGLLNFFDDAQNAFLNPVDGLGGRVYQVVDHNDIHALFQELNTGVASDITGTAGYQYSHVSVLSFLNQSSRLTG